MFLEKFPYRVKFYTKKEWEPGTGDWGLESVENQSPLRPCPPLFQGGKGVAMLEGVSLKKSSKIFIIFSKIAVSRYLYSRGT